MNTVKKRPTQHMKRIRSLYVKVVAFVVFVVHSVALLGMDTSLAKHIKIIPYFKAQPQPQRYARTQNSCFRPHPYFHPSNKNQTLHLPFINVGFPKCGTTSVWEFFKCGRPNFNTSHQYCRYSRPLNPRQRSDYCGTCFHDALYVKNEHKKDFHLKVNKENPENPLEYCGNYHVYTQIDRTVGGCYWPQVDMLDEIHGANPNATFLFTMRNFDDWYSSLSKWNGFHNRLGDCTFAKYHYPESVHNGTLDITREALVFDRDNGTTRSFAVNTPRSLKDSLELFYCNHVNRVRDFVIKHPTHALIEIYAGDLNLGKRLSDIFGINETCWGRRNANPDLHHNLSKTEISA